MEWLKKYFQTYYVPSLKKTTSEGSTMANLFNNPDPEFKKFVERCSYWLEG
jgi:hypothetical protein